MRPPAIAAQPVPSAAGGAATAGTGAVAGRVTDERGVPLAGVRVRVADPPGAAPGAAPGAVRTARDGRFVLPAPAGARVAVLAEGDGLRPRRAFVAMTAGDTARIELALERLPVALGAVQVTATPTARDPLAVPQSTTTIGAAELQRNGTSSLAASLGAEPGIAVRTDGPGAAAPIVRGLSGERIVVLHDGVRVNDLAATAPDHGVTIDPLAARRIEIVRGPAALLYGNNALGGVVHVLSDDVPLARPLRAERSVTAQTESAMPGAAASLDLTAPLGRSDSATGLVLRARLGGRTQQDQRLGAGAPFARLGNTSLNARHGVLGLGWVGREVTAGVAYRGYDFGYGMPVVSAGDEAVRLRGARHELLARGELRRRVGVFEGARVDASAQHYEHRELVQGETAMRLGANTGMLQAVARTRGAGPLREGAVGVLGLFRDNGVDGELALTPPNAGRSLGAFVYQELAPFSGGADATAGAPEAASDAVTRAPGRLAGVRVPFGLRYDAHVVESRASARFGAGRRRAFGGASGSVGLSVPLGAGLSLGTNVARAVRAPAAEELFSEAGHAGTGAFEIGDPDLRLERSTGVDAVLRVERRRAGAQLSAYANRVGDWIGLYATGRDTLAPDGVGGTKTLPLYQIQQRDATLRGVEGSAEWAVRGDSRARGVILGVMGDVVVARDRAGAPLPFMPPARVGGNARWEGLRGSAGARVRHAFAQRRVPDGEFATDAYTLIDLHTSWRLPLGGATHLLTLRVDNATDALWRDGASRVKAFAPGVGRSVVVGVRSEW